VGVLAGFRSDAIRPVNARWLEADRIVTQNHGRSLLNSQESKRALWHKDHHVRTVVRLLTLTNKFAWVPGREDLRDGDEAYLQAIDVMIDDSTVRTKSTIECLLLGGASDEAVEELTGLPADTVEILHDVFFDIRGRLDKHLLVQDLLFGPAMMQGGAHTPIDTERIISFLAGYEVFHKYRLGVIDDEQVRLTYSRIQQGLMGNQAISSLLRRSFGFQSTEGVIEHLQQQMLLDARQNAAASEDAGLTQVRRGINNLLAHNLKPMIAEEGDPAVTDISAESVTVSAEKVQGVLK